MARKVYEKHCINDDMLPIIFEAAKELGYEDFEKTYKKIFVHLMTKFKEGTDDENVKFIAIDNATEEIPLHAIVIVNAEIEKIPNPNEGAEPKPEWEPFFSEKCLLFPTLSDKLKIITINKNFDRIFRENFFECVNSVCPIESDKEEYMEAINKKYDELIKIFLEKLVNKYQKELLELVVSLPKEGGAEGEEEEKEEEL